MSNGVQNLMSQQMSGNPIQTKESKGECKPIFIAKEMSERLDPRSYTLCPLIDGDGGYVIVYKNAEGSTGFGKVVRNREDFMAMSLQWRVALYPFIPLYPLPPDWQ